MLQSCISCFNPSNPSNYAFPTWVSHRNLPFAHHDKAIDIVKTLGEVIDVDNLSATKILKFCVIIRVDEGWTTSIVLSYETCHSPNPK